MTSYNTRLYDSLTQYLQKTVKFFCNYGDTLPHTVEK